jgi:hypothetical protein
MCLNTQRWNPLNGQCNEKVQHPCKTQIRLVRTLEFDCLQSLIEPVSSADNNLLSSMNSTHVTSPPCPGRVANTPRSMGDCPKRQMTAWTKGKLTCESQSATNFPEPNATREELEAAEERLNLLTEAEIYSTDAVMTMVGNGRTNFASTSNVTFFSQ